MIKVLHVVRQMNQGGAEQIIMDWMRHTDSSEFKYFFLVHSEAEGRFDKEIIERGGKIIHLPFPQMTSILQYIKSVEKVITENDIDIVHGHIASIAIFYFWAARVMGVQTIAHSHNVYPSKMNLHNRLHKMMTFPIRFIAQFFLAPTKLAGEDRFGKRVTAGSKFEVIPNGIDQENFSFKVQQRKNIRDRLSIPEDATVFVNTGRLVEFKNQGFLLDVFRDYIDKYQSNSFLIILGDGELRDDLTEHAKRLGILAQTRFVGVHNNVGDFLSASDVFVFPSLSEGQGIAVIEAQANGIPVVMSTGVPKQSVVIPDMVKRVSLDTGVDYWADAINEMLISDTVNKKRGRVTLPENSNLSILNSTKMLEKFYRRVYLR